VLRLTNLADYSVVVMTAAARCIDGPMSAAVVASRTGIPAPTVAKVMGLLTRGGLLASSRGVAGGFRLARIASAISVADIIEAVEGPIALTNCQHGEVSACALEGSCAVRPHWRPINIAVRAAFAAVTLADLAGPAVAPPAVHSLEVTA
jgi:FeS assembly SUF system regulator